MAGVELDADTAHQAATDTLNTRESVDGNLNTLRNLMEDLSQAWTGAAGTSLQNTMTTWDEKAAQLLDALSDIAEALDSSATASTEQDAEDAAALGAYGDEL